MNYFRQGFTIVELLIIIVIVATLASISIVGYGAWQQRIADTAIKADLTQAANLLESAHNFKNTYPTSLFAEELSTNDEPSFQPSEEVNIILRTNATLLPHYTGLTQPQSTQLFLDACNSAMPVVGSSGTTYHTSCYAFLTGLLQYRLASTGGKSAYISNPAQSDFTITCQQSVWWWSDPCDEPDYPAAATAAVVQIKQRYQDQGGTFPANMPLLFGGAVLPEPDSYVTYDPATKFCLEGVSTKYPDHVFHVKSSTSKEIITGTCPADSNNF